MPLSPTKLSCTITLVVIQHINTNVQASFRDKKDAVYQVESESLHRLYSHSHTHHSKPSTEKKTLLC